MRWQGEHNFTGVIGGRGFMGHMDKIHKLVQQEKVKISSLQINSPTYKQGP